MLQLARWMRRGLLAHPGLVDVRRVAQGWTARTGATSERWLSLWQQSGLPFTGAVRAAAASATAIVGAIAKGQAVNVMAGSMTAYLVLTGLWTVRPPSPC